MTDLVRMAVSPFVPTFPWKEEDSLKFFKEFKEMESGQKTVEKSQEQAF